MTVSKQLRELSGKVRGIASRGSLLKPPLVHFGAPRQISGQRDVAWWHIPVFIEPGVLQQKSLKDCTVHLVPFEGAETPVQMHWRTGASTVTTPELTLEGEIYFVPVAFRKEGDDGKAVITAARFFAERKAMLKMPRGKSKWRLLVRSGSKEWKSRHTYILIVPDPETGNGHFTLEIRYDGIV